VTEHLSPTYKIGKIYPLAKTNTVKGPTINLKGGGGGYVFLFRSEMFFQTTRELEYLFFLSRKVRNFFSEYNIRLYGKNCESDYFFFPPPKSEYFFSATLGIRIFF
jgi:hypothetical protein